MLKKLQS